MSPAHFLLEVIIIRPSPWDKETPPQLHEIYPQNLSQIHTLQYLVVRGSKKQQRRGGIFSNFTKGETFFSLLKNLRAIWVNLNLHPSLLLPKKAFLSPSVWPRKGHSFERRAFWFALVPYTHGQNRKKMMEA